MDKNQESTAKTDCPTCHAEGRPAASFCWECGTLLKTNGSTPRDASRQMLSEFAETSTPQNASPQLRLPQFPARSVDFWQGLAAGLGAGAFILFLLALAA